MSWTHGPLLARNELPFFSVAPSDPLYLPKKEGRRRHGRDGVGSRRTIRPPPRPRHLLRPLIHPPKNAGTSRGGRCWCTSRSCRRSPACARRRSPPSPSPPTAVASAGSTSRRRKHRGERSLFSVPPPPPPPHLDSAAIHTLLLNSNQD
ncbi:hypothetical protein ACQJBY_021007 [Aegilops geniculata]